MNATLTDANRRFAMMQAEGSRWRPHKLANENVQLVRSPRVYYPNTNEYPGPMVSRYGQRINVRITQIVFGINVCLVDVVMWGAPGGDCAPWIFFAFVFLGQ